MSVFRLAPRRDLPLGAQLLCALIRRDKEAASRIFQSDPELWLLKFLGILQDNALASFSSSLLFELKLKDAAADIRIAQSSGERVEEGVWIDNSLDVNLRRMSSVEMSRYDMLDDKFIKLLDALQPLHDQIVWPKGIALSRTLYSEPFHRYSGDFDCILRPQYAEEFHQLCINAGYSPIFGDPGFCNQLEVGPANRLEQLLLSPCSQMIPSAVIGYTKEQWPIIDPKFNPLDRGLVFKELSRFYSDATTVNWRKRTFRAPSTIDQLLIALTHSEKDRFHGWKSLIDIHLLADRVQTAGQSQELFRRCEAEGIGLSAWAGLTLARDRFGETIPLEQINRLYPTHTSRLFSFSIEPLFYWNCSSLPGLLLNVFCTGDFKRKKAALTDCLLPSNKFIQNYYANGKRVSTTSYILLLVVHWAVLMLPGFLVRKTFGHCLWKRESQYAGI